MILNDPSDEASVAKAGPSVIERLRADLVVFIESQEESSRKLLCGAR